MDMEGNWNGSFAGTGTQGNAYKYNGKEFNNDYGLDWYRYGARWYDPAIGRFPVIDRFTEKYSPVSGYHYGLNNPIKYIDVNGDSSVVGIYFNSQGRAINAELIYDDKTTDGNLYILWILPGKSVSAQKSAAATIEQARKNDITGIQAFTSESALWYNRRGEYTDNPSFTEEMKNAYLRGMMGKAGLNIDNYTPSLNHNDEIFGFSVNLTNNNLDPFPPIELIEFRNSRLRKNLAIWANYHAMLNALGHENVHEQDWIDNVGKAYLPNPEVGAYKYEFKKYC